MGGAPPDYHLDFSRTHWSKGRVQRQTGYALSKALALLILAMMVVHMIRPLGLPGLRYRRDVWKIAIVALVAIGATVLLSHGNGQ